MKTQDIASLQRTKIRKPDHQHSSDAIPQIISKYNECAHIDFSIACNSQTAD